MSNHALFVHGINASKEDRKLMTANVINYLTKYESIDFFKKEGRLFPLVKAICWRSLGNFVKDLNDLKENPTRWHEAVDDISSEIDQYIVSNVNDGDKVVLIGHSMGQPLLIESLYQLQESGHTWVSGARVLTIGGPMGNPLARAYFMQMNQRLWADALSVKEWFDMWNPEDPVNGGIIYEQFLASKDIKLNFPGHPTPFAPLKEHSSYFDSKDFYDTIKFLIKD